MKYKHREKQWTTRAAVMALAHVTMLFSRAAGADELGDNPPTRMLLINSDGTNLREILAFAGRTVGSPQWAPDGKWIAYDTWSPASPSTSIEIVSLDGSVKRRLGKGAMPSWSPDGRQIVCMCDNPQSIVVMDVEGNGRETLMLHWGGPRWSPKGNRIISPLPWGGISVFDLATGKERIVAPEYTALPGLSISPDGKRFVFGESHGRGACIATISDDAAAVTCNSIVSDGDSYHSSWSPDGKTVVFNWRRRPDVPEQLYLYAVDADQPPRLLKGQGADCNNRDPSWSPDGKSILFMSIKLK